MSRFDEVSKQLLRIKHDMEQNEAKIDDTRDLIHEIGKTGLLTGSIFLGPRYEQPYVPGWESRDSSRIVQAALFIPEGFGVCRWDMNEFWELEGSQDGLEQHARAKFESFAGCSPAEKKFLRPFVDEMLDELADVALVAASKLEPGPCISADDYFAQRMKEAAWKPAK
jgi:hypothetical protein